MAVVTDGTAVLGLGDIGPAAALPVMEGKAALFKQFAGVDAWPVCLDTKDTEEIISIVKALAPVYGGVNLEDIAAPRCFEIERRLRDELDIPVFHDDQHGTAIVVLAALINALRVVDKKIADVKIVISGVGAAGHAIIQLLQAQGASHIVACARNGAIHRGETYTDEHRQWIAENTNPEGFSGSLHRGAGGRRRVHRRLRPEPVRRRATWPRMADRVPSCWPWPTPIPRSTRPRPPSTPRWWPPVAATSRTRSTTCSPSPASSAGCSTPRARDITTPMLVAAAEAIADCVSRGRAQRQLHRAQRLRRPGRPRGRRGRRPLA